MKGNVYFLGAGASKGSDFELPLMKGFFREEDLASNEYTHLKEFKDTRFPETPINDLNMEEVITHLELILEGFRWDPVEVSAQYQTRTEFLKYVKNRLDLKGEKQICEKHRSLFKDIKLEEDTILTLNYDLIVDKVLYEITKDTKGRLNNGPLTRGYCLTEERATFGGTLSTSLPVTEESLYIKLHGSIDWLYCPNPSCPNNRRLLPNWIDSPSFHNEPGGPCGICGTGYDVAIIPPSMKKSFEKFPKLGLLWRVAFEKLRKAGTIILIGISLPDSDYYLRWLIREAMIKREVLPNLIVVNPDSPDTDKNAIVKAKALTGVKKAKWYKGLLNFIEKKCEGDV